MLKPTPRPPAAAWSGSLTPPWRREHKAAPSASLIGSHSSATPMSGRGRLLTDQQWREWCTESRKHCITGTFVDAQLAGVMANTQQWPALPHVVEWEATWLAPEYRGFGIAQQAYE